MDSIKTLAVFVVSAMVLVSACGADTGVPSTDSEGGGITVESLEQSLGLRVGWIPPDCTPSTFEGPTDTRYVGAVTFVCGGETAFIIARLSVSDAPSGIPGSPSAPVAGRVSWIGGDGHAWIEVTGSGAGEADLLRIAESIDVLND